MRLFAIALIIVPTIAGCQELIIGRPLVDLDLVEVSFTPHRYGFDVSFDSNTDFYFGDKFHGMEAAHFATNLGGTLFSEATLGSSVSLVADGGRMGVEAYLYTDRWKNYQSIPDYQPTVWTAAGAAEFSTAATGSSKATRYPDHGQEMYTASAGDYGYNGSVFGTSNGSEARDLIDHQVVNTYGNPTSFSLSNGAEDIVPMVVEGNMALSIRNSSTSLTTSSLISDYTLASLQNRGSTIRFANYNLGGSIWGSRDTPITAQNLNDVESAFASVVSSGGFFSNFSHFHWIYDFEDQTEDYKDMLQRVRDYADANSVDVYSGGYGGISEHQALVEKCSVIGYRSGGNVFISVTPQSAIPYLEYFATPVTVKYTDKDGWAGAGCNGCSGIRKDGIDYYVDVPANTSVELFDDPAAIYYDFTSPTLSSSSTSGGVLSITSNQPVKASVFYVSTGQSVYGTTFEPIRSTSLSTSHSIDISAIPAGTDIYVGLINETGASSLTLVP